MERLPDPVSADELLVHFDWVRRLARNLVRDPELAEDVAQETWLSALEKPARERSNLRGWLARIVENTARQHGRSESARARREHRAARAEALPSTGELVELASLQRALVGDVLDLEEPYRSTILLHYFRELSAAKIAERERVSIDAVRSRITRGLEKLRAKLDRSSGGRERWMGVFAALSAPKSAAVGSAFAYAGALAAVLMIALGAMWIARPRSAREATELTAPDLELAAAPHSPAQQVGPGSEPRVALASAATSSSALAPDGITLRFVDAETGEPIAGLAFTVLDESRGRSPSPISSGKSDPTGHAILAVSPGKVLAVETVREPPHAPCVHAFDASVASEVEVRVGRGGTIRGRVVDDQGTPRPGVVIVQSSGPNAKELRMTAGDGHTVVAETDSEGRFAVEHVRSRPRKIHLVEGEQHAERWDPVSIGASDPRWLGVGIRSLVFQVDDRDEVDIGDFVLPRDAQLKGRVRYPDGAPASGVLVSFERRRFVTSHKLDFGPRSDWKPASAAGIGPGEIPGETLTRADGSFELPWGSIGTGLPMVWLFTRTGYRQQAKIPVCRPGETCDAGEIVLQHRAPIELALTVDGPGDVELPKGIQVRFASRTGEQWVPWTSADVDGVYRIAQYESSADASALIVSAAGFERARIELPAGPSEGARFEVALKPRPRIRTTLAWSDPRGAPPIEELSVVIDACLLGPLERPRGPLVPGIGGVACCGLGGHFAERLTGDPARVDLSVATSRAYWVHVRGNDGDRELEPQAFGPWVPSETDFHPILVEPRFSRATSDTASAPVPPKTKPNEPWVHTGTVRAQLAAADDGRPLRGSLRFEPLEGSHLSPDPSPRSPQTEGTCEVQVESGTWRVSAVATAGRARELGRVEVVAGETRDLGTILLEPLPVFRARVLDADGKPASGLIASAGNSEARIAPDGLVELAGDWPASFVLRVRERERVFTRQGREQSVLVETPRAGEVPEIRLARWIALSIELDGLSPELRNAQIEALIEHLDPLRAGNASARDERKIAAIPRKSEPSSLPGFDVSLAPGKYRIELVSLIVDADPVVVEISEESAQRTIRIAVR